MEIRIMQNVLKANDKKAQEIRQLLKDKGITLINLISSPGSGKTTLLEKTIPLLKEKYRIAIIEGDLETDRDAKRLEKFGVPVVLINTCGACHLESISIEKALNDLNLDELDIIFVENIGNLVCPSEFDIGENFKVALLSIPEGDDKILKYPLLFQEAKAVILNKIDLIDFMDFDKNIVYQDLAKINPKIKVFETSAKNQTGLDEWIDWLQQQIC